MPHEYFCRAWHHSQDRVGEGRLGITGFDEASLNWLAFFHVRSSY